MLPPHDTEAGHWSGTQDQQRSSAATVSRLCLLFALQMKDEKPKKEEKVEVAKLPGEGDPFSAEAIAYSEANKDGGSAFQPRGISDATVITDAGYIENDDEPWHSTCRPTATIDLATLAYAQHFALTPIVA